MKTHALDVPRFVTGCGTALRSAALASVAIAAFWAGSVRVASAIECTGPFRQCAIDVGAQCVRKPDGRQLMRYWDNSGNVTVFERCVGSIFEARGLPNPYKSGLATAGASRRGGGLTVPDTELLYPIDEP